VLVYLKKKLLFISIFSIYIIYPLYSSDLTYGQISLPHVDDLILNGKYELAQTLCESLINDPLYKEPKPRVFLLLKLALLYWNNGNLKNYFVTTNEAAELARKSGLSEQLRLANAFLAILDLYNKGKSFFSEGNFKESIDSFNSAINYAKSINSPAHELKCKRLLSLAYWGLKDYINFYNQNKEALQLAFQLNHKKEQARCLNNLGLALWKLDDYSSALNNFFKALEIAQNIGALSEVSDILANIGLAYRDIGDFDSSIKYIISSSEIDRKNSNYLGIYLNELNLGSAYRLKYLFSKDIQELYKAISIYNSALKERMPSEIRMKFFNNLSSAYNDLGDFYNALEHLKKSLQIALSIHDAEAEGIIYNNMGSIYFNLGNYEQAIEYHNKAIELALKLRSGQILWEAYLELANAYRKKEQEAEAIKNYKNSIAIIEDIRSRLNLEEYKASYLGTDKRLDAYYKLIDLLVKKGLKENNKAYLSDAFNYLERARARAFLDSLELSKISFSEGIDQKLRYREVEIMNEISTLYTKLLNPELTEEQKQQIFQKLDSADQNLEALKREMRANNPAYANLKYPEFVSLQEAQKKLIPRDTLVIAYLLSQDASYAFALNNKRISVYPLPSVAEIKEKVTKYLTQLTDSSNTDFRAGYELYRLLLEPTLDNHVQRIVIIPDDILHFLPFETLRLPEGRQARWLIEQYSVSYAPSLTSLKEILQNSKRRESSPTKALLAVGDPAYELNGDGASSESITLKSFYEPGLDLTLSRLHFSLQEVEKIASYFPAKKREILVSGQASEDKIKSYDLTQFRIVHLATHCIIDDKKPARSSIVLRLDQDPQEDGLLQMREIFGLKLNADLVALSACQTAFGPFIKGEGIEGLSRALFYAGASSLLLSLWPINDQATSQLMDRFYYHLKSHLPVEKALQKAKLELINSGPLSHPFYWAGFVLSGDTARTIIPNSLPIWLFLAGGLVLGAFFYAFLKNGKNGHDKGKSSIAN